MQPLFKFNSRWMILGGSPSAPDYCNLDVDYVIAGGPGIMLRIPDIYIIAERTETFKWYDLTLEMQARGGRLVVTSFITDWYKEAKNSPNPKLVNKIQKFSPMCKNLPEMPYPDEVPADEIISVHPRPRVSWDEWESWSPGEMCYSICGVMGIIYAVRNQASEIHMVGLEGYDGKDDYFGQAAMQSSRRSLPFFDTYTLPFMNKIVKACPDIKFFLYGQPRFEFDHPNVQVVSEIPSHV